MELSPPLFSHDPRQHYCRAFAVQQTFYREFAKNESAFQITGLQSTVAECFGVAEGIDDVLAKKKSGPPDFMRHSLPLGVAHSLLVDRLPLQQESAGQTSSFLLPWPVQWFQ